MEFWETFDAKEIVPYLSSVDNRLRDILAVESGAASADSVATDTACCLHRLLQFLLPTVLQPH